jgi:hypothetical protein
MARILIIAACLCGGGASLFSQAQNPPPPQPRQQSAQPEQDRKSPFESIPPAPPQVAAGPGVIERIDFRGARQVPQDGFAKQYSVKSAIPTTKTRFVATLYSFGI